MSNAGADCQIAGASLQCDLKPRGERCIYVSDPYNTTSHHRLAATIGITNFDERCSMVNLDPDTARPDPEVLREVVRERGNKAGCTAP
jgi:hypothetical protein